ncbi:MAG TPA: hypothetical protein VJZ27_13340, partial [Aggregatilineales bacterium]|nr:hypothetical protein [Aggregatilineales bacterium]
NEISGSLITEIVRGKLFALPMHGGTNYIDVRDVVAGHLAAAEKGRTGEKYILGAVNMTHKAFQRLVCNVVGVTPPRIMVPGFMMPAAAVVIDILRRIGVPIPLEGNQLRLSRYDIYVDASKMWHELHKPQIDIRQSIQDTYQWYKVHGHI